jgi:hypothetical protein
MRKNIGVVLVLLGCLGWASGASAQDKKAAPAEDAAALAQKIQNPLATLVSLPLQGNYNLGSGPYERTIFNLNVQPVIPYKLNEDLNLITRTIVPLNSVPVGATDSVFGMGDTSFSMFLSPNSDGAVTWGVGPVFSIPTASNPQVLGSSKLSLGPTGVVFVSMGKWTFGAVGSNTWSIAGSSDRESVNFFYAQWFVNYNFGKGWAVGTAPIVTANWKADPGNKWTVPWGLQVSKLTHFGSRPVNLLLGYYKNSEQPDGAADSQIRFQLNLLFPQRPR